MRDALPEADDRSRLVVGVGNAWRRDDAAGLAVARAAGGVALEGECSGLVELWSGRDAVVLVDACASGAAPGTVVRLDASSSPLPAARGLRSSTHAFGVAEAIELGRSLGRLPPSVAVYAIEGADFAPGSGLTPAVAAAVDAVVAEITGAPLTSSRHSEGAPSSPARGME